MKKGKGILIAVLCVLIASMVGVMIWMITLGGTGAREFWKNFSFSFSSGDAKLVNEQELDVTGYSEISITYRSADLIFETSETGSFTVSEYMAGKPEEENLAKIQNDTKNGTLSVEEGKSFYAIGFLNFGTGIRYVKIGIPAKFRGSLNIKTGSGNVTMSDSKAGDLSVTVGSGDVTLLRIGGKTVTCRSGSGNLNLNQIEGDLDVLTGSGDVNITGIKGNVISETGSFRRTADSGQHGRCEEPGGKRRPVPGPYRRRDRREDRKRGHKDYWPGGKILHAAGNDPFRRYRGKDGQRFVLQ